MEATQKTILELEVKARLQLDLTLNAPAEQRKEFLDPKQLGLLIDELQKFAGGLHYDTCVTQAERYLRETELSVHGTQLLRTLDTWLRTQAFGLRSCGLLDLAIGLRVSVKRILACWIHLAGIEITDEAA
jgi:hypothetical protein